MTSLRLELADPSGFETPNDYIEQHLAPLATELHRLCNEFLAPGSTSSEEHAVDMVPSGEGTGAYWALDTHLGDAAKSCLFDGREYFAVPKALLREKQLKVQLTATCYVKHGGAAMFRLLRGDGEALPTSEFYVESPEPITVTRTLSFGEGKECVTPHYMLYSMQARRLAKQTLPVCRRFSMSFILI